MAQQETIVTILTKRWEEISCKIVTLAVEFPQEKFEHPPAEGVRTFGDVLRHVAFWNQYVADSLNGKKADDSANEVSRVSYSTKTRLVEVLKSTSAEAMAALRWQQPDLDAKTVDLVLTFIEHTCEHYGQLAVYSRLAGITPPASRER